MVREHKRTVADSSDGLSSRCNCNRNCNQDRTRETHPNRISAAPLRVTGPSQWFAIAQDAGHNGFHVPRCTGIDRDCAAFSWSSVHDGWPTRQPERPSNEERRSGAERRTGRTAALEAPGEGPWTYGDAGWRPDMTITDRDANAQTCTDHGEADCLRAIRQAWPGRARQARTRRAYAVRRAQGCPPRWTVRESAAALRTPAVREIYATFRAFETPLLFHDVHYLCPFWRLSVTPCHDYQESACHGEVYSV